MIRIAVDDAIDDIIESGINERETDIEAIKEKIFLEVASRLEEAKLSSQVRFNDTTEKRKNAIAVIILVTSGSRCPVLVLEQFIYQSCTWTPTFKYFLDSLLSDMIDYQFPIYYMCITNIRKNECHTVYRKNISWNQL